MSASSTAFDASKLCNVEAGAFFPFVYVVEFSISSRNLRSILADICDFLVIFFARRFVHRVVSDCVRVVVFVAR